MNSNYENYDEDVEKFNEVISQHYEEYQRKLKQYCFINGLTYDEDTLQETYLKVQDIISRKGIKDKTEQGILNYFFLAFRNNLYQAHLQTQKKLVDANVDVYDLLLLDENNSELEEQRRQYADLARQYILKQVEENFDSISYSIFRLRYLLLLDGKTPTFAQIKELTQVVDTRKRLLEVQAWAKRNITKEAINNYITHLNSNNKQPFFETERK